MYPRPSPPLMVKVKENRKRNFFFFFSVPTLTNLPISCLGSCHIRGLHPLPLSGVSLFSLIQSRYERRSSRSPQRQPGRVSGGADVNGRRTTEVPGVERTPSDTTSVEIHGDYFSVTTSVRSYVAPSTRVSWTTVSTTSGPGPWTPTTTGPISRVWPRVHPGRTISSVTGRLVRVRPS